jgi:ABC-2 type transport system permease protein
MITLLKTEWLKIRKYRAFWWIIGITALSYPGINYIFYMAYDSIVKKENTAGELARIYIGNPFSFPAAWHTIAYFSSWFIFIPAVVVIMFITNEYSFKTHRQNVVDGWSRNQFMLSKMIDVLIVAVLITILYLLVCIVSGFANSSPGANVWSHFYYTGLFALQTFAQLSLAFLVGFLVRKAFMALGVFLFYFFILEPILVGLAKIKVNDMGRFLPLEISDRLIPIPAFLGKIDIEAYNKALEAVNIHILYSLLLTGLIWFICFRINSRRDL